MPFSDLLPEEAGAKLRLDSDNDLIDEPCYPSHDMGLREESSRDGMTSSPPLLLSTMTISKGNVARNNAVRPAPVTDIRKHWQTNVYFNVTNPRLSQAYALSPPSLSTIHHVFGEEARPFRDP